MKKRILAFLLCAAMVMLLPVTGAAAVDMGEWQTSKSKTATQLDSAFESKVTLSLPSAEEQLVTYIVFVLDKSTSAALEQQALKMLSELKGQAEGTGAKVKVGVVIFNKVANVTGFMDLATEYDAIEEAITQEIKSGTNTHAGLLAGKAMLDGDTSVDAARKYLIFVSDGITYMYNEDATVTAWTFFADGWKNWAGPDNWRSKYNNSVREPIYIPEDWNAWLSTVESQVVAQGTTYEYTYGGTVNTATPQEDWKTAYANSVDKALYLTWKTYNECISEGYNCYAMTAESTGVEDHPWGPSFMNFLAGNEVNFSNIQNDILYLLGAGSSVVDFIGKDTDNRGNPYDFKFVPEAGKLALTVGNRTYTTVKAEPTAGETARFLFTFDGENAENQAEAPFVLRYYENGTDNNPGEHFVWDINVAVKNFERVQLTYTVVLTNPQKTEGTYGEYDGNGSRNLGSLYTNNKATLYPVASDETEGRAEDFPKPTVSYTVGKAPVKDEEGKNDYKDTVTIEIKGDKKEQKNPHTGAPSSLVFVGAAAALKGIF